MAYKFRNIVINEKGEYSEELGKLFDDSLIDNTQE